MKAFGLCTEVVCGLLGHPLRAKSLEGKESERTKMETHLMHIQSWDVKNRHVNVYKYHRIVTYRVL